jgi:hypothetical protein
MTSHTLTRIAFLRRRLWSGENCTNGSSGVNDPPAAAPATANSEWFTVPALERDDDLKELSLGCSAVGLGEM